jgi:hypothetical protein
MPVELHPDGEHVHLPVREHVLELHAIGGMQRHVGLRRRSHSIGRSGRLLAADAFLLAPTPLSL